MGNIVTAVGWILNPANGEITGYRRKINGVDTDFPFPLPGTSAPVAGAQLVANPLWEVNASTGAIEGYRRRVAGIDTNYPANPGTGTVAGNLRLGVQWLADPLTGALVGYRVINSDGSVTDRAVSMVVADGPTLDLVFAGVATNPLGIATLTDNTLSLDFASNVYKIVVPYETLATFAINYAVMPTALLTASINTNPEKTLFKDTLIGGRALGDINNSGTVTSTDSLAYTRFNNQFWINTDAENEYIRTVLNPYMLANANLYAAYLLPG